MPSRPLSWCWCARPAASGCATRWDPGCTRWRFGPRRPRVGRGPPAQARAARGPISDVGTRDHALPRDRTTAARRDRPASRALSCPGRSSAISKGGLTSKWPGTWDGRSARSRAGCRGRMSACAIGSGAAASRLRLGCTRSRWASTGLQELMPEALVESTTLAAVRFGASRIIANRSVASLAQGVLRAMFLSRFLKIVPVLLVACATVTGAGLLAAQGNRIGRAAWARSRPGRCEAWLGRSRLRSEAG